ncbi:RNA polymerase sigma factor [Amycolatopsis sp. cmx-11-51]|uniref:RNA polymerase sigma factor n=1 Tax=unclassified Amycolatopsis TaxID=2618356 RepID=UPI0039E3EE44
MSESHPHPPPWSAQDLNELTEIMTEYEPRLSASLRIKFPGIDHENVVGQALQELTQHWHHLKKSRRAWLTDVAKKRAIDAVRAARRQGGSLDDPRLATLRLAWAGDDEHAVVLVYRAIAALPQHLRYVLSLRMFGYEIEEIARRVNRAPRTVEDWITRARQKVSADLDTARHDREGNL